MQINITCGTIEELLSFAQAVVGTGEAQAPIASPEIQPDAPAEGPVRALRTAGDPATQPALLQQPLPAAPAVPVQQPLPATPAVPVQQPLPAAPAVPVQQQAPDTPPAQPQQVPTSTASYTPDDLARAAMTLMDSGRQADLLRMLQDFGVESLPALPRDKYGAFATALRGLGAQI